MADYTVNMDLNETLELDYLVEQISNNTIKVSAEPSSGATSLNYVREEYGIFDPSESGTYKLEIDGQTIEIDVADIPDSGIAHYEFEQSLADRWGNNNGNGTGGLQYVTNAQEGNYALNFDGTNNYLDNSGFGISGTGASFAFWAYPRTVSYGSNKTSRVLFWGDGPPQFAISLSDPGQWMAQYYNGSSAVGKCTASASANSWTHVAYVWHDQQEAELYLDGSSVDTSSHSSSASFSGNANRIGLHGRGVGPYYDGIFDGIRYYSKGLSDSEVSNLYNTSSING
jgi:hypothetical protein